MLRYEAQLSIDCGDVGYHCDKQAFAVKLNAAPLVRLIEDAHNAHRIYELMSIDRPGDVWRYVNVEPLKLTRCARERILQSLKDRDKALDACCDSDLVLSYADFDRLFEPPSCEADPEQESWGDARESPAARAFASQLLAMARDAVSSLGWNDPLVQHVVASVRDGTHTFHHLPRWAIGRASEGLPPNQPAQAPQFYAKLDELLQDGHVTSVAYRGEGDYLLLRKLATRQRQLATITGHCAGMALHVSALVNFYASNQAWGSQIHYFDEGLAHGDLRIESQNQMGAPLRDLVAKHHRVPGRYILSDKDEGEFPGFSRELGDGWALYTRHAPDSRRIAMGKIHGRRYPGGHVTLQLADEGASIYSYDKTLVLVGATVPLEIRELLADLIAPWQRRGGEVMVLVEGEASPFDSRGCSDLIVLADTSESPPRERLLQTLLWRRYRWADVVISLEAPEWVTKTVEEHTRTAHYGRVWPLWVAATAGTEHFIVDFELGSDLASQLRQAMRLADGAR